ncbi:Zinc finger domain protein [Anopheles sinensis]|uniref:Zinc finger domain protein n=1 Tax=Anopheles sinensis TaxID=74873 RepID=A0A084VLD4_ANOSI|nr:Zinc finger domain protein [Anopheles sinensis]
MTATVNPVIKVPVPEKPLSTNSRTSFVQRHRAGTGGGHPSCILVSCLRTVAALGVAIRSTAANETIIGRFVHQRHQATTNITSESRLLHEFLFASFDGTTHVC